MKSLHCLLLCASLSTFAALLSACAQTTPSAQKWTAPPVSSLPDDSLPAGIHSNPADQKWVFFLTNLYADDTFAKDLEVVKQAGALGYDHVFVGDFKFMKWDTAGPKFIDHVREFMHVCHENHIQVFAGVAPLGYANELLVRDANLAEGLPVRSAQFEVGQGLCFEPKEPELKLVNGDFNSGPTDLGMPMTGWEFTCPLDAMTMDGQVSYEGQPTLRMEMPAEKKEAGAQVVSAAHAALTPTPSAAAAPGATQVIKVQPFHYYHVKAMFKTDGGDMHRSVKIDVIAPDGTVLNYQTPAFKESKEWRVFDMTFDSLEFSQVSLRLCPRKGGKIWWADVKIEPGEFVNVVRRAGTPLQITSLDGKTIYQEGVDFSYVCDPFLGRDPAPGVYTIWHSYPRVTVLPGGRLHIGDKVLASYYVTEIIHDSQVMCSLSDPETLALVQWQIQQMHKIMDPDGYVMGYDELRMQGYDEAAPDKMTMAQLLAQNVQQVTQMIQREAPGKPIAAWSDLFDPFHNAKPDHKRYYLVKGQDPWYGAWQGLSKDIIILNWHGFDHGDRIASLKFFADRGNPQILSGYYDHDPSRIVPWLSEAAHIPGVQGVMYTTWKSDYKDLQKYRDAVANWKPDTAAQP